LMHTWQSLKGVGGEIVILEEAVSEDAPDSMFGCDVDWCVRCQAYCDEQMINEVVLPLLAVQSSVLLCISTLLSGENHYTRMFNLENDDGTPLFEQIQISLVCAKCLASDHPEKCNHKSADMPRWLSAKKLETIKALLSSDPAMLLRESMGVSAESTQRAFKENDIQRLIERPFESLSRLNHVFVAVDPAAGGTSAFAVCSIGIAFNGNVVVRFARLYVSPPFIRSLTSVE